MVGVGVLDQRGGGAGGVRMGTKFSVFGGVGRGALIKLWLLVAAAVAAPGIKGGAAAIGSIEDEPFVHCPLTISNELFPLPAAGDTKLCAALQFV